MRGIVVLVIFLAPAAAYGACSCRCVDGEMQAICASAIDLPPICPPAVCPLVPPQIEPIGRAQSPPLGTTSCRQRQVLDPVTRRYEWRTLCR